MARIIAYPSATPTTSDLVVGTQITTGGTNQTNPTKNFKKDYVAHHYAIRSKKKNKIIASFIKKEIPYGLHYTITD